MCARGFDAFEGIWPWILRKHFAPQFKLFFLLEYTQEVEIIQMCIIVDVAQRRNAFISGGKKSRNFFMSRIIVSENCHKGNSDGERKCELTGWWIGAKFMSAAPKNASNYHLLVCNLQEIHARMLQNASEKNAGQNNGSSGCFLCTIMWFKVVTL